jgi:hypothetical protein
MTNLSILVYRRKSIVHEHKISHSKVLWIVDGRPYVGLLDRKAWQINPKSSIHPPGERRTAESFWGVLEQSTTRVRHTDLLSGSLHDHLRKIHMRDSPSSLNNSSNPHHKTLWYKHELILSTGPRIRSDYSRTQFRSNSFIEFHPSP